MLIFKKGSYNMIKMNWLTREEKIEILMLAKCTRREAVNYVDKNNATIFTSEELLEEVKTWQFLEEEEYNRYVTMTETKQALPNWDIVDYNNETYFIEYLN